MSATVPSGGHRGTLVHIVRGHAECRPEAEAITYLADGEAVGQALSFGELDRRVRTVAGRLQELGATGKPALLLFENDVDFVVAFLGCLYARVVAVTAYPPRSGSRHLQRLQALVADAQAEVVLVTPSILGRIEESLRKFSALASARWVVVGEPGEGDEALAEAWRMPALRREEVAFLQYTSGSLGSPKGVMLSHGNLMHNAAMIAAAFGHSSATRHVSWLPLFHDMGLIGNVLQALYLGTPCVFMSPAAFVQQPARWLRAISTYQATTSGAPSSAYDLCVRKITDEQLEGVDLRGWRVAYNGAEPVRADVLDAFAARFARFGFQRSALYPCYGMAESTLLISGDDTMAEPVVRAVCSAALERGRIEEVTAGQAARRLVSCGHSWFGQEVRIVDPKTCLPCPPGQVGEIWLSGESVALGYWNRPELTQETFQARLPDTARTFLRTGDLGFVEETQLYVTGRLKDLIVVRGRNHYPQDIEATVERSSGMLRPGLGAAFSIEGAEGERLVVVHEVERVHVADLEVPSVVGQIREAVAEEHEIAVHAVVLLAPGTLPKTSSGKVQRSACRKRFLAGTLEAVGQWSVSLREPAQEGPGAVAEGPRTREALQGWLTARVAARLRIAESEIDPRRPLTQYGLESTVAASLSHELGDKLGVRLGPLVFWEYPSIERLCGYLNSLSS
ncbi:AMP-binding protein [Chondromyces crocatus]|nr:AMP-binding protein [Chondromyces crocatus]AIR74919.1 long-chain-fatty-acid-CoA ligase [Chondromyces crocatus]AKT38867.1 beta-ketoacyl synthase [Chondromyces crocatus]